ncbi:MAG: SRPBCC family protein [Actinomycetota bacterium]
MPSTFRFDRRWVFSVPPEELWRTLSSTDRFPEWWAWLSRFESDGLVEGTTAHCVVRAPLPYRLSFQVAIREVVVEHLVDTLVSGDLEGPARLELAPHPDGSTARLAWEVELRAPMLRATSTVARPLMEWAHGWVVDTGVRQFRRAALGERPR